MDQVPSIASQLSFGLWVHNSKIKKLHIIEYKYLFYLFVKDMCEVSYQGFKIYYALYYKIIESDTCIAPNSKKLGKYKQKHVVIMQILFNL